MLRLFGFFRRTLELDDVAVGVGDIERGAVALRTIAPSDLADGDAVPPQMGGQRRVVEATDAHREMVQVAPRGRFCRLRRGTGRHQINHRGAGAQLHELGLVEPALDVAAQDVPIEPDRAVEIGDAQHEMVEPGDLDRTGLRRCSALQIPYIRHCRLLLIAVAYLTAISRRRQADYCGGD